MSNLRIANQDGFKYGETAYIIGNEYGTVCVSYGRDEGEALDHAVDWRFLDAQLMSKEDHAEYEANGWDDSYSYLGNAGEVYWTEYLWIKPASERIKTMVGVIL
jgi:hypothetical protein